MDRIASTHITEVLSLSLSLSLFLSLFSLFSLCHHRLPLFSSLTHSSHHSLSPFPLLSPFSLPLSSLLSPLSSLLSPLSLLSSLFQKINKITEIRMGGGINFVDELFSSCFSSSFEISTPGLIFSFSLSFLSLSLSLSFFFSLSQSLFLFLLGFLS